MDALNKLKVVDLKKMLKSKGLSTDGSKANLIKRLYESGDKSLSDNETSQENVDTDEDLILGNDDNSDTVGTASETKAAATSSVLTTTESNSAAAKSPTNLTKISFPAEPQKVTNGKMGDRIKRFGVVSEDVKKKSRAERFQITAPASDQVSVNNSTTKSSVTAAESVPKPTEAMLKKRAERFGIVESPAVSVQSGQPGDLLKKRAERFGASASATALPAKGEEKEVMLKRKARFSTSSDEGNTEAKKQKRAARFGIENS